MWVDARDRVFIFSCIVFAFAMTFLICLIDPNNKVIHVEGLAALGDHGSRVMGVLLGVSLAAGTAIAQYGIFSTRVWWLRFSLSGVMILVPVLYFDYVLKLGGVDHLGGFKSFLVSARHFYVAYMVGLFLVGILILRLVFDVQQQQGVAEQTDSAIRTRRWRLFRRLGGALTLYFIVNLVKQWRPSLNDEDLLLVCIAMVFACLALLKLLIVSLIKKGWVKWFSGWFPLVVGIGLVVYLPGFLTTAAQWIGVLSLPSKIMITAVLASSAMLQLLLSSIHWVSHTLPQRQLSSKFVEVHESVESNSRSLTAAMNKPIVLAAIICLFSACLAIWLPGLIRTRFNSLVFVFTSQENWLQKATLAAEVLAIQPNPSDFPQDSSLAIYNNWTISIYREEILMVQVAFSKINDPRWNGLEKRLSSFVPTITSQYSGKLNSPTLASNSQMIYWLDGKQVSLTDLPNAKPFPLGRTLVRIEDAVVHPEDLIAINANRFVEFVNCKFIFGEHRNATYGYPMIGSSFYFQGCDFDAAASDFVSRQSNHAIELEGDMSHWEAVGLVQNLLYSDWRIKVPIANAITFRDQFPFLIRLGDKNAKSQWVMNVGKLFMQERFPANLKSNLLLTDSDSRIYGMNLKRAQNVRALQKLAPNLSPEIEFLVISANCEELFSFSATNPGLARTFSNVKHLAIDGPSYNGDPIPLAKNFPNIETLVLAEQLNSFDVQQLLLLPKLRCVFVNSELLERGDLDALLESDGIERIFVYPSRTLFPVVNQNELLLSDKIQLLEIGGQTPMNVLTLLDTVDFVKEQTEKRLGSNGEIGN